MNTACHLFEAAAACNHRPPQQTCLLTCQRLHPGYARAGEGRVCRPGFSKPCRFLFSAGECVCARVCLYLHSRVCADRVQSPEGSLSGEAVNFLPGKKKKKDSTFGGFTEQ